MRRLMVTFLAVIAVGGATGAVASGDSPPNVPSDVTCAQHAGSTQCFYPAHDK